MTTATHLAKGMQAGIPNYLHNKNIISSILTLMNLGCHQFKVYAVNQITFYILN